MVALKVISASVALMLCNCISHLIGVAIWLNADSVTKSDTIRVVILLFIWVYIMILQIYAKFFILVEQFLIIIIL